jgi:hypothetical protein
MRDLTAEVAFLRARVADDEVMAASLPASEERADLLRARARAIRGLIGDTGTPGWAQWHLQVRKLTWSYAWHPDFDPAWLQAS